MRAVSAILAVGMMAGAGQPAAAADEARYPAQLDGRATVSAAMFSALDEIIRRHGRGQMTGADAERVVALALADGKLDAAETDLLEELASWNIRAISVTTAARSDRTLVFSTQSGAARNALDAALDAPLLKLWDGDAAAWGTLVTLHGTGPRHIRERIGRLTRNKMFDPMVMSDVANTYAPFRQLISSRFALANALPPDQQRFSRNLLYYAANATEKNVPGGRPRFLFNWIIPPAPP